MTLKDLAEVRLTVEEWEGNIEKGEISLEMPTGFKVEVKGVTGGQTEHDTTSGAKSKQIKGEMVTV